MSVVYMRLAPTEVLLGALMGVHRRVAGIEHHRQRPDISKSIGWDGDIEAAIAELAVAKYLDRYWYALAPSGDVSTMRADIGDRIEVRSTEHSGGHLIVYDKDPDDHVFYLVVRKPPVDYRIVGWLMGRDGKLAEHWNSNAHRPAYFVPQERLNVCNGGQEVDMLRLLA